jgi:hypothetical protein
MEVQLLHPQIDSLITCNDSSYGRVKREAEAEAEAEPEAEPDARPPSDLQYANKTSHIRREN